MKVIVAGTRAPKFSQIKDVEKRKRVNDAFHRELFLRLDAYIESAVKVVMKMPEITEIVEGGATGADRAGKMYATYFNLPKKTFNADWTNNGKAAGPVRNSEMAEYVDPKTDILICLWDMSSPGTDNMIKTAKKRKIKTYIVDCKSVFEAYRKIANA